MANLRALIFDVDGTLAETERDGHRVAFNQTFQAAGLDWNWSIDLYGELLQVAGGKERIQFYIEQYAPPLPHVRGWSAFIANLHKAKTDCYKAILKSGDIQLRPGVRRVIEAARKEGLILAIATTSRLENALTLLKTTLPQDAPTWFDVIAAGDIVPYKKPASDIYHYVLDKMALSSEQCLVVEDTEHGLAAATGAGLKTVVTVNGYTQDQDFSKATVVLNHLGESDNPFEILSGQVMMPQNYFDLTLAESILQDA
ncbi:MAG: HAD-IA family hydrolase [Leptolyngbya sp. SIO1D8]|nr:HAD-IA family hydrolase [Leptolyngbya sp. SIO1D8]